MKDIINKYATENKKIALLLYVLTYLLLVYFCFKRLIIIIVSLNIILKLIKLTTHKYNNNHGYIKYFSPKVFSQILHKIYMSNFFQNLNPIFLDYSYLYNKLYPTQSGMKIKTLCFANYSMLCNEMKIPKTLTTQVTFGVNA